MGRVVGGAGVWGREISDFLMYLVPSLLYLFGWMVLVFRGGGGPRNKPRSHPVTS